MVALEKIKNRLSNSSSEERFQAAKKIGLLKDSSLIPLIRKQLQKEPKAEVQFELVFTIWKLLAHLE